MAWLCLAAAAIPAQADPRGELARARHDLAISEQVLARVTERVEAARSSPATESAQRQHLDEYLARVQRLVALNRERVQTLTRQVDSLPPEAPAAGPGAGASAGVATEAEEIAALEEKLGGSLAEFDQLLLEEARRARTRASGGGAGGGSSGGSGGESSGNGTAAAAPGAGGAESTASGTDAADKGGDGARASAGEAGSPGGRILGTDPGASGASAAAPPDVGDGHDDDIVARQIRKAAETETDPELREKLWEEYRRYKGTQ